MFDEAGWRSWAAAAGRFYLVIQLGAALAGCGGDHRIGVAPGPTPLGATGDVAALGPSLTAAATPAGTITGTASMSAPLSGAAGPLANVKVSVSPALTPAFDPTIHDYVIHCTTAPEVQFTGYFPGGRQFGLFAPGDLMNSPFAQAVGSVQQTLTLKPGQRFRFYIDDRANEYSVRCLPADFPPLTVTLGGGEKPQAEWYVFAPIFGAPSAYVILTDSNGTPVWWMADSAVDAKVLGPDEITWTTPSVYGKDGKYVIRNFSGQILNTLVGNLDLHDLQPTPSGTYLALRDVQRSCPGDCADLSPWGGSAQAAPIDAEIIEIDAGSNVVWSWKTRDHIGLSESGAAGWLPGVGNDIIHMNAVEPDGPDGVLFSARHLNAVYRIIKSSGAIDWKLGGTARPESLTVVGDNRPTAVGPTGQSLSGQHDIRRWPDGSISVHDNGTLVNRAPSILRYQVDPATRTSTVVELLQDARVPSSFCCGSARRLPNGHWLAQWGGVPFMTELDGAGNPVLTIDYNSGPGFSYQATAVTAGKVSESILRAGMDALASR